jgi:hypothetical protein
LEGKKHDAIPNPKRELVMIIRVSVMTDYIRGIILGRNGL